MEHLGPMIYKRLHDNSWEVRDSVLELLYAIVEISNESKKKLTLFNLLFPFFSFETPFIFKTPFLDSTLSLI